LFSWWKNNIPVHIAHADEMEEVIHSSGLQMPRETWCRKEKNHHNSGARYSHGTTKHLPQPVLTKPKAMKPKVDEDNPSQGGGVS